MASLDTIFKKAFVALFLGLSFYGGCLFLLTFSPIQRFALYGHKVKSWHDLNKPEQFGFARNQITPFKFKTTDDEDIYAWLVLPLALYAKHESKLLQEPTGFVDDITQRKALKLLREGSDSRLVISFHGNSGTVAQGWRTDTYRTLADGCTENIHILTFDYRGFGYSSGSPTEDGIVLDGIAAVDWALNVAKVPRERIVIFGQSLGTYVASAVAEHYALRNIEFAGLLLVAGFTDLPTLLSSYTIAGYVPVLSPLKRWQKAVDYLNSYLVDTWQTAERLTSFVRASKRMRLSIVHALDDMEIPWLHSQGLFIAAANATSDEGLQLEAIEKRKAKHTMNLGGGTFVSTWRDGDRVIREQIIAHGGHSRILTYAPISLAVLKAFDLDDGRSAQSEI